MNAPTSPGPAAPYPGLRPFQPHEAPIFFGRAEQIDGMLARLEKQRFLAVVGASGSGKSSLVRAGLLPALDDGFLMDATHDWRFVIAQPGQAPYANLAAAYCREISTPDREPTALELSFAESRLRGGRRGLVDLLRKTDVPDDRHVLVLIDQFEELFRFRHLGRRSADERDTTSDEQRNAAIAFVDLLLHTSRQTDRPVYVVITMRSDFLGDCDAFFGLPEAISDSQFLTPRLTRDQICQAVAEPLRQFHAAVEPEVVNLVANEVGTDPDQLPLMQHALMRMWQFAREESAVHVSSPETPGTGDPTSPQSPTEGSSSPPTAPANRSS